MSVEPQAHDGPEIENLFAETRTFPPDPAFTAQANATAALYDEAEADYEAFWAAQARERLSWSTPFSTTLEWDLPFAKWFADGELNVAYNCVDRHVEAGLGDKVAYHWIGEPGDTRTLTYADLMRESSKAANALLELGVTQGRPGRDLHADDPRAADRDARLRADRRAAHRRVRRVLRRGAVRADQRLRREGPDHRGRRLAARQEGRPQAPRRRGGRGHADDRARHRRRPLRRRRAHGPAPRPLVARDRRPPAARCAPRSRSRASTCSTCSTRRGRPRSRRGSSTPRPATCSARRSPTGPCSTSSPTTSTGARRTSAG